MKVPFVDLAAQWAPLKQDILKDWEKALDGASFVGGPVLAQFEKEFASFCGTRFAIGVSNGTSALVSILRGLGVGPGDRVGVQAETFVATAYAVKLVGATPVLMDPTMHDAQNKTIGMKAYIVVHIYGQVREIEGNVLARAAAKNGFYLIEDACQAVGAPGVGTFGIAAAFSFYPAKNLGCAGQGGAVITNDEVLKEKIVQYINQGTLGNGLHAAIGSNERLDPIQAVVLSHGLKKLPEWNARRIEIARRYNAGLPEEVIPVVSGGRCVYHLYPVKLQTAEKRGSLASFLKSCDIATARHYPFAISQQDGFRTPGLQYLESALSRSMTLPMFPTMTGEQVEYVLECIRMWAADQ